MEVRLPIHDWIARLVSASHRTYVWLGTEMGGAYISSCLVYPQTPSAFTTPIIGSSVVLVTEDRVQDIRAVDVFEGSASVGYQLSNEAVSVQGSLCRASDVWSVTEAPQQESR